MGTGLITGLLANTLILAGVIVWLSRGGGAAWLNALNANALQALVVVLVIMETAGAVNGVFVWAMMNGKEKSLSEVLGYLGIWFGFLGTHVFAIGAVTLGKRVTDTGTDSRPGFVQQRGEAKEKVEKARATASPQVNTGMVENLQVGPNAPTTTERPAMRPSQAIPIPPEAEGK